MSDEYNVNKRNGIDFVRANNNCMRDDIIMSKDGGFTRDTTHLDAVDNEGFMMSAMPNGA
jgi:gamma-glutamyltranspeptidase